VCISVNEKTHILLKSPNIKVNRIFKHSPATAPNQGGRSHHEISRSSLEGIPEASQETKRDSRATSRYTQESCKKRIPERTS
jgi:hypothetical protein